MSNIFRHRQTRRLTRRRSYMGSNFLTFGPSFSPKEWKRRKRRRRLANASRRRNRA